MPWDLPILLLGDSFMQLDTFYTSLIQVLLLDGLALALGGAFIITSICGVILMRRTTVNLKWCLGTIVSMVIGVVSGVIVMTSFGIFNVWAGSGIYGLIDDGLADWTALISTEFNSYNYQLLSLAYLGALAGHSLGCSIGMHRNEEATPFGILFSILGLSVIAIGFTFTLLQILLTLPILILFSIDGVFTLLFILSIFLTQKNQSSENTEYYSVEIEQPE